MWKLHHNLELHWCQLIDKCYYDRQSVKRLDRPKKGILKGSDAFMMGLKVECGIGNTVNFLLGR